MHDLIIVGAGGFGWELAQFAREAAAQGAPLRLKGFLDDDPARRPPPHADLPILGSTDEYRICPADRFLISLGDPAKREQLSQRLRAQGAEFASLIHPQTYVAPTATIGDGCIVAPFATVGSYATLGDHVLLNLFASAGHDARIGSYGVLSPYSVISGGAVLEEAVFVGAHGVVTPERTVGARTQVAAGAVVYRDLPSRVLAVGNPAKAAHL